MTSRRCIKIRLSAEQLSLLTRAAAVEGVDLGQFLLAPALKRARRVIAEAEQVATSARGYKEVLDALANPQKPTQALLAAMRSYEAARIQQR
jgi:uncharacterized protein (DUF1778 family)